MNALRGKLKKLAMEPPFRLFVRSVFEGLTGCGLNSRIVGHFGPPRIPRRCALRGPAGAARRRR